MHILYFVFLIMYVFVLRVLIMYIILCIMETQSEEKRFSTSRVGTEYQVSGIWSTTYESAAAEPARVKGRTDLITATAEVSERK